MAIVFQDDVERAGWFQVYAASLTNDPAQREAEADAAVESSRRRQAQNLYLDDTDGEWAVPVCPTDPTEYPDLKPSDPTDQIDFSNHMGEQR